MIKSVGVLAGLSKGQRPKSFKDEYLREIRFPLGGIGAGTVSLGGRGQFRDWEIGQHPDKGNDPGGCFALIHTETADGSVCARVLEGRLQPPFESGHGLPLEHLAGVPRMRSCTFTGAYPFAYVELADKAVPVRVTLEAFNPLIPGDPDASGIPAAVLRYHVHNPGSRRVTVSIGLSIMNMIGGDGKVNEARRSGATQGVLMGNPSVSGGDTGFGTMALAVSGGRVTVRPAWPAGAGPGRLNVQAFWLDFKKDGRLDDPGDDADHGKCFVSSALAVEPHATKAVTFTLAWHFPNRTPASCGWGASEGCNDSVLGNYYATQFDDAWGVVEHLGRELPGLEERTRRFVTAVLDTNLPPVSVEAALNNVSTLRTQTCFRTSDGAFYGFEGCGDQAGSCMGSCTHVWNYEQTTAFLFPSLARSMRETEFLVSTDETGFMSFRTLLPAGAGAWHNAAADGQMGCLMKLYREWQLSGDTDWMLRLWPKAKKALEFCWTEGGWDADCDGVMEGAQHNTYDFEWFGPNPQCQVWYLGALRAAEKLAVAADDAEFATKVRALFEKGRLWTDENLFNGDYYVQQVRAAKADQVAGGLMLGWGDQDPARPKLQLGDGCLVDQLVGQFMAYVTGLGHLLDGRNVKRAVRSIFRNNRVSMAEHACLGRTYALNDETGMVICSQPRSDEDGIVHWFFTEFMTGFEYQEAVLLLYEGYVKEGLTAIQDIRDRYDGLKRNPWNEAECGHHYARAMAAWGAILALTGFQYSAVTGRMQFLPRIGDGVLRSFWSVGSAWGTVDMDARRHRVALDVLHGRLELASLQLPAAFAVARGARHGRRAVRIGVVADDSSAIVTFARRLALPEGARLTLS